jgi:hypothetical protein
MQQLTASAVLQAACVLRQALNKDWQILEMKKRVYSKVQTSAAALGTCEIVCRVT